MYPLRTAPWATLVVLSFAIVLPLWGGCGGSSSPGGSTPPVLDFAVVDDNFDNNSDGAVLVWLDALNNPASGRAPDVLLELSEATEPEGRPRYVRIAGDHLFVLVNDDGEGGAILIWLNYRDIADNDPEESNPEPDIVLDSGSDVNGPNYMAIFGGDLYISNGGDDNVLIFRDVETAESGDAPDVVLGGDEYTPHCVLVSAQALYVTIPYDNMVFIYNNPALLETEDEPDVVLGNEEEEEKPGLGAGTSALEGGSLLAAPEFCFLEGNTLHVTCSDAFEEGENGVWSFSPAGALVDYQAPDTIRRGPWMKKYKPTCVREAGGKLWMSTKHDTTGLLGFGAGALPAVELMSEPLDDKPDPWTPDQGALTFVPGRVDEFVAIQGGLIGVSRQGGDAIFGYLDASSIETDQPPDYAVWWPEMKRLRSIDAVIR